MEMVDQWINTQVLFPQWTTLKSKLKPMRLHLIPAVPDSLKTNQQHSSKGSWETWQASCETGSVDTRVTGWWESDAIWQSAGLTPEFRGVQITYLCSVLMHIMHLVKEMKFRISLTPQNTWAFPIKKLSSSSIMLNFNYGGLQYFGLSI